MEFWGVEVKAGETVKVKPGDRRLLHLSQAALGESKKDKGTDSIPVFVKVGDKKHVIGNLSSLSCPQVNFDLVFEKEFELSHNWKNGSVHLMGYKNSVDDGPDDFSDYSDDSMDEDLPLVAAEKEKPVPKAKETAGKTKTLTAEKINDEEVSSDDDLDFDSDDDLSGEDSDGAEDDGEDEDSEEDEETPTPKKAVGNKKRQAESATKIPVPAKKAKSASPQKTDGKKGGQTATPHPAMSASKTPNADKSKPRSKSFKSEQSKAKHSARK